MPLEKYVSTKGLDRGRIKDLDIAQDLAYIEDAWREDNGGIPMSRPPQRLGKGEFRFRDSINTELRRLIRLKMVEELDSSFESVYSDPALKEADPENSDEGWLSYRLANRLATIGKRHGFDDETCYEILEMPFSEGFEAAHGYLTRAGLDPEEVLASFMEEPEEE